MIAVAVVPVDKMKFHLHNILVKSCILIQLATSTSIIVKCFTRYEELKNGNALAVTKSAAGGLWT
jgi:hypothetical protein